MIIINDILSELNNKNYIYELNNNYDINFCRIHEIDDVVNFIDLHWRKGHIFVNDRKLLNWQHFDELENRYNFVVARNKINNEIHSILGFIPTNQFDKDIKNIKVWPCIWKVKDNLGIKGLGVSLYYFLKENLNIQAIDVLGISDIALSIYKKWGFKTGKITTYYIINPHLRDYKIMKNVPVSLKNNYLKQTKTNINIKKATKKIFKSIESDALDQNYKSKSYYINRFFNHPSYHYDCYLIKKDAQLNALFFCRTCYAANSKCIRIVEYAGDKKLILEIGYFLQDLTIKKNAEYVDFLLVGWQDEMLKKAGFNSRDESDIIIPNYFEPFEQKNISLDYAHKSIFKDEEKFIFYKADSDQDRPNI